MEEERRGRVVLCLSLLWLPPSPGCGRMWKQIFCPLLTDHALGLSSFITPSTALCLCLQFRDSTYCIKEIAKRDTALGTDSQCGGEENIARGGGGKHIRIWVCLLAPRFEKSPAGTFSFAPFPPRGDRHASHPENHYLYEASLSTGAWQVPPVSWKGNRLSTAGARGGGWRFFRLLEVGRL